ncbi:outer dense fiber protein 2 isoform X2 [Salarias fasciatus]|uniref:outer dense fiber protein 2 isoform X2 n=1 Tax=Salarias fasciatus TaxID=181472 RepID=UPI001176DA9E|nr:outer dense fiber protein 2 isoform X2 [Salarias fasciatus]
MSKSVRFTGRDGETRQRRTMRTRSTSPPIHVHVDESTPVHVHVKSFKRTIPVRTPQGRTRVKTGSVRPTAQVKTREPWVPPGKASVRDASFKWEGPTHCLEITPPGTEPETSQHALRLADLMSEEEEEEEEEGLHARVSQHQRKIDSLLTEVSSLKNEVELQKQQQQLEQQSERATARQQEEREETLLRPSMERLLEDGRGSRQQDGSALLRMLTEAELDGAAAARQVSALRESLAKLSAAGSRLCVDQSSLLDRQKDLLLQKLHTFEETNRALRRLLREQQDCQVEWLAEQRDSLLKRLADMEAENAHVVVRLEEKEREVKQLSRLLEAEKDTARSSSNISRSLESTRAHLQGQLRSKAAQNERLSVQLKALERAALQQKAEVSRLTDQLSRARQQAAADRDALKRASRAHKQRAQRCQDAAGQLSGQLLETEQQVSEALAAAEAWKNRLTQETRDKSKLEAELELLSSRVSELTEQLRCAEDKSRADREALLDHLQGLTTESAAARLENQTLKAAAAAAEEKLASSQSELQEVKASIRQYESLLDGYKVQVQKTRAEADEYRSGVAEVERRAEAVRAELLGRLAELEPLPEALRRSQLQLQEAQDRERSLETRSAELGATLADLRMKVETQGSQVELVRQKNKALLEENRQLQLRVESLERKLEEAGGQNAELLAAVSKREEAVLSSQRRLEEKSRESALLGRRLEEALSDARQQMSESRERAAAKERSAQARILDLETQLSRTASEVSQLRRSKEEVERRYQSRLQDVKDRLEQTDSTNRSLQNYVQFLKASYASVFGDLATSSALRASSPL